MLFAVVSAPFIFAFLLAMFGKYLGRRIGYVAAVVPAFTFAWFLGEIPAVKSGAGAVFFAPWLHSFGVNVSFHLDGLGLLFSVVISGVGCLVYWYSIGYMTAPPPATRILTGDGAIGSHARADCLVKFYVLLLVFTGAMLGAVLSRNLVLIYIFWELTSFSSFLLIGYSDYRERSRYGAQKSLYITVAGGFAILAAFVLIGHICGGFEMSRIAENRDLLLSSPLYSVIVALVLFGAFTKSAQIPFHIWLPDAMEAPTPISCYLHSATMVKLGIFLLLLMNGPLGGTDIWFVTLSTAGILSLVWGAGRALMQTDLKAILALHTTSQLGLVIALIGCGSREAVIAAVFHMVNHSIFKGSLFLVAGMVDHSTGTRDMRLLRGLSKAMPVTSALAFCGAFAMAGVYPFNGFLSKEMLYENSLLAARGSLAILGPFAWLFPVLAVVGCIFTFLDCMMIVFRFFYGGPLTDKSPRPPHEPAKMMLIPSAILASGTILAALFANPLAEALLIPAADAVTGTSGEFHISYWHGFNMPFIMTAITTAAGVYLYLKLDRIHDLFHRAPVILSGNKIYDWLISDNALANGANRVTNSYMTGRLQNYVRFTCVSFILAVAAVLGFKGAFVLNFSDLAPVGVHEITWLTAMAAATGIVVKSKKRAVSVLSLGLVGYGVAFLFVLFSAPDLALTQLVVETVSIVLFFLAFRYLPPDCEEKEGEKAPSPDKAVNLAISIAMGAAVTTIALVGHGSKMFDTISNFYIENSRLLGGGSNVVNVLLVDFRALDTMGEISVISVAAIGVFALISLTVGGDAKSQPAASARRKMQGSGVVINTVLRPLTFFILMFSFYLLWNGHNAPGGGFIAGLMTAAGIVLLYVNHGSGFIRKNLPFDFKYLVGLGLACSMSCGLGALLFGYPFLTQTFGRVHFPHLGEIELATALIFDLGVYLVVTGGCLTIITGIGQSGEPKEEAL